MDEGLVARAQGGDRDAFELIVNASFDRCHGVAMRLLRDSQLAEDAVQQAMVNIWRDLPRLRDPARYDAWSYKLLVRACYAEYKRAPRWMPGIEEGSPAEPRAGDDFGAVIDRDQLERGFRRLSMEHRAVVVLHHYLDLPLEQVGNVLGVPTGTVSPDCIELWLRCGPPSRPTPDRRWLTKGPTRQRPGKESSDDDPDT